MRKKTLMAATTIVSLLFISLVGMLFVEVVRANPIAYSTEIFIKEDGSISPATDLLARNGDTYYLTGNTTNYSFTIQKSNIVFEGRGYTIDGSVGIIGYSNKGLILTFVTNVTVKDVTVKNFWSDNIAVLSSSYCTFSNIQSIGGQPFNFQASNFNKVSRSNINDLVMSGSNNTLYGNNIYILRGSGSNNTFYCNNIYFIWKFSTPNFWDNGIVGNYWSGYSGSEPQILNWNNIDNFPYISPVDIQLPIPEPTQSPSGPATVSPTPGQISVQMPLSRSTVGRFVSVNFSFEIPTIQAHSGVVAKAGDYLINDQAHHSSLFEFFLLAGCAIDSNTQTILDTVTAFGADLDAFLALQASSINPTLSYTGGDVYSGTANLTLPEGTHTLVVWVSAEQNYLSFAQNLWAGFSQTITFKVDSAAQTPTPTPNPTRSPTSTTTQSPTPTLTPTPTPSPTLEPTLTPTPTSNETQAADRTPLVLAAVVVVAVAVAALVYFWRRKP